MLWEEYVTKENRQQNLRYLLVLIPVCLPCLSILLEAAAFRVNRVYQGEDLLPFKARLIKIQDTIALLLRKLYTILLKPVIIILHGGYLNVLYNKSRTVLHIKK